MRKRKPSRRDLNSMLRNYGHVHNYAIFAGRSVIRVGHRYVPKRVYKCSFCDAKTYQD